MNLQNLQKKIHNDNYLIRFIKKMRKVDTSTKNLTIRGYCIDAAAVDNRISVLEEQVRKIKGDFFKSNHSRDEYIIDFS